MKSAALDRPEETASSTGSGGPKKALTQRKPLNISALADKYGLILAWAVLCLVFTALAPTTFATLGNVQTIFASQTILLCITLSLVLALSANEFDLSVGALAGTVAGLTAYLTTTQGWPFALVLLLMLGLVGLVAGLHCFLIVKIGVPSIIVTLGTQTLLIGSMIGIAGPQPQVFNVQWFSDITNQRLLGLPLAWYAVFALVCGLYYVLEHTPMGRYIRFVGGDAEVARLAGVRVNKVRCFALLGSSVLAGCAGVLLVGIQGSSDLNLSNSLLLPAFAAAFLGATAFIPGKFNAWGSFAAVYFLVTGVTGLQLLGLAGWVEQIFYGTSLIVAVALGRIVAMKRQKRLAT